MKLCVHCQFFIVNGEKCAQSPKPPDYVHGRPTGNYSAFTMRSSLTQEDCGPDAKLFKPIPVAVDA